MALSDQVVKTKQSKKRTRGEAFEFDHRVQNVREKRDRERPVKTVTAVRRKCEIYHEDYRGDGALVFKSYDNWWIGYMTDEAEHVFHKWLNMKELGASPNEEHEVMVDYEEVNSTRVLEFANYKMN